MDQDETWHASRPWPWPHCVRWGPGSPSPKGAQPPFLARICCGQTAAWIKMPLCMEVGLGPGDCVRWGPRSPLPKKGWSTPKFWPLFIVAKRLDDQDGTWHGGRPQPRRLCDRWGPSPSLKRGRAPPQYSAHIYCGQTAGCIKMPLGMVVGLSPGDFVLDGDPVPLSKKVRSPQLSAHVCCGQMSAWIKMPLGTEVGLGPGDFVFDGDPATPRRKGHTYPHPIFAPCLVWPNGWMKTPLGLEVGLGPGHIVLDGVPALRERGTAALALFSPCLLWPRLPISATADLLYYSF